MTGPRVHAREVEWSAVRSQGAGGQNVNKVATAAQLRFDIRLSSLPEAVKARLLALRDQRISDDGVVVIKAQDHRTLGLNKRDALARLQALVDAAAAIPRPRIATRPTAASRQRRLQGKTLRGQLKTLRSRVAE